MIKQKTIGLVVIIAVVMSFGVAFAETISPNLKYRTFDKKTDDYLKYFKDSAEEKKVPHFHFEEKDDWTALQKGLEEYFNDLGVDPKKVKINYIVEHKNERIN